mgnify:CR=1 FL=1
MRRFFAVLALGAVLVSGGVAQAQNLADVRAQLSALNGQIQQLRDELVRRLGPVLASRGYRGHFGIDFVVEDSASGPVTWLIIFCSRVVHTSRYDTSASSAPLSSSSKAVSVSSVQYTWDATSTTWAGYENTQFSRGASTSQPAAASSARTMRSLRVVFIPN